MRFNPDKRFLDRVGAQRRKTASGSPKGEQGESIDRINKIELSLSARGKEEFRPYQMLSNLFLSILKILFSCLKNPLSFSPPFSPLWPVRRRL